MSGPARAARTAPAINAATVLAALLIAAAPVSARESLGVFGRWAAFRDVKPPRCYAIAEPVYSHDDPKERRWRPYVTIANWPRQRVMGQVHLVMSRPAAKDSPLTLKVGGKPFPLVASGAVAWAPDAATDAAIVARLRRSNSMEVSGRTADGKRVRDIYELNGASSAVDAATLACATR